MVCSVRGDWLIYYQGQGLSTKLWTQLIRWALADAPTQINPSTCITLPTFWLGHAGLDYITQDQK